MVGRTARLWSVRIPRIVWEDLVGGNDGAEPLLEYVHGRIDAAMRARGFRWIRGRWIHVDDLKAALE